MQAVKFSCLNSWGDDILNVFWMCSKCGFVVKISIALIDWVNCVQRTQYWVYMPCLHKSVRFSIVLSMQKVLKEKHSESADLYQGSSVTHSSVWENLRFVLMSSYMVCRANILWIFHWKPFIGFYKFLQKQFLLGGGNYCYCDVKPQFIAKSILLLVSLSNLFLLIYQSNIMLNFSHVLFKCIGTYSVDVV